MEVTGPQMVLVMKLTTFAWNVVDGRRPAEVRSQSSLGKHVTYRASIGFGQMAKRKGRT